VTEPTDNTEHSEHSQQQDQPREPSAGDGAANTAPVLMPTRHDPTFRSLAETLIQDAHGALRETKREIKDSAYKRLELLDRMQRELVDKAREILEQARRDVNLHEIKMTCAKTRGHVYYLYENPGGDRFFSLLAPQEYYQADPDAVYYGSWLLNYDGTWSER